MARQHYTEDKLIQEPAAALLANELGWESLYAQDREDFGPDSLLGRDSRQEIVLKRDVLQALKRLNPGHPEHVYHAALALVLSEDASKNLIQLNEEKYKFLRDGVNVPHYDPIKKQREESLTLYLVDFNQPSNNRFLAVRELWIKGEVYTRRTDLIGYINGLPLVFMEFKSISKNAWDGFQNNYKDYLDTVPHLFTWNAFNVFSNGEKAVYGSLTASADHYYPWKRLQETDPEPDPNQPQLPTLLRGMMHPATLLDLVQNFILFDRSSSQVQKIVARNHQYLGVNRVIERLLSNDPSVRAEVDKGKLGVFWHTQGSGKSYSMVFLTEKICRKISNQYSFVIVTDRVELDEQIYGQYKSTLGQQAGLEVASSAKDLKNKLSASSTYVFTLIQKFSATVTDCYSDRDNVLVISDEAHRTQYGRLSINMRKALPKAQFLGFTGTPLIDSGEKELTRQTFGDYVSIYDFKRAVADGATLPLFYESRGDKLKVVDPTLNERVADYLKAAQDSCTADDPWTPAKEELLLRKLKSDYAILTSDPRLDRVATDFVEHFQRRRNAAQPHGSKAMLVCLDKITCVRMYDLIQEKWQARIKALEASIVAEEGRFAEGTQLPDLLVQRRVQLEWMKTTEMCVVVSQEQGEIEQFKARKNHLGQPLNIQFHREKMSKRKLEAEFKDPANNFRVAIVCAMWLTGFDVKPLATLYLDKPMQGHTLMQAIARVNRVGAGKRNGLIIDYNGMIKSLRKALAVFAQKERSGTGLGDHEDEVIQEESVALADYAASLQAAVDYLKALDFDVENVVAATERGDVTEVQAQIITATALLCKSDEQRKTFQIMVEDILARNRSLFPNAGLFEHANTEAVLATISRKISSLRQSPNLDAILQDFYTVVSSSVQIVDDAPTASGNAPVQHDLSRIDFNRLQAELTKVNLKTIEIVSLEEKLQAALSTMLRTNSSPARIALYEKYQQIVDEYNKDKDQAEIQKIMDALQRLNDEMSEEQKRFMREGLKNEEQLAVFDLLQKDNLTKPEREKVKQLAQEMLDHLMETQLKVDYWSQLYSSCAQVRVEITEKLYEKLPESYNPDEIEARIDAIYTHLLSQAKWMPQT